MADSSVGPSSFCTQANALLRKNLIFQKRNIKTNIRLVASPVCICILLLIMQIVVDNELDQPSRRCGCTCVDTEGSGQCEQKCGIEYSTAEQARRCSIPHPPTWPPLLQVPAPQYRAVRTDYISYGDLPDERCRRTGSCPATMLITGENQTFGQRVAESFFPKQLSINASDMLYSLALNVLGSETETETTNFLEPAFISDTPVDYLQPQCTSTAEISFPINLSPDTAEKKLRCVRGLTLWRNSSSAINNELFKGYRTGNPKEKINEIVAAYDFMNSHENLFNVTIWYNSTYEDDTGRQPLSLLRLPRSVNLASNAYLEYLLGPATKILFDFVNEMPKPETKLSLDFSSLLGGLFFTWIIAQLFPVILTYLVYEKQQRLRIMMKMHGLGDGPYWLISYAYFLVISSIYMLCFVIFGKSIGLKLFILNADSIQFVFYFLYINLQVSLAFLVADFFSNVKTATVVGYLMVFASGLLGGFLFEPFLQDTSFPRAGIIAMELFPGFALYRGLYEFSQAAFQGSYLRTDGMQWKDLIESDSGMREVIIIIAVEWVVVLAVAYYADQVVSSGRSPLFFLRRCQKNLSSSFRKPSLKRQDSKVFIQVDKLDVDKEREKVEQLLLESSTDHAIICDNLKKIYPGRDGNPEKFAVRELSLALPYGECFGMLGPNGAGKTSFINMMIGLIKPTSGTAYIHGMDILTDMNRIYTSMGVCPQHDLLWETLTGREHLLFYGRLKNLTGAALTQAVEESLKSVNLFHGGVADKKAGKYSGGMKRRLSVAISLIGDPKVVYMDEPSTGLDPASRTMLWKVVRQAKQNRAIILTTHSMEEAEHLCDRLGIFVDGSLQCIGNPKELKARYGGSYVFTMTTAPDHEEEVERLVRHLSRNATKIYQISGTQKFELPKNEVRIAQVFAAVEDAKSRFAVQAWGLADTTLEDVFIKVARGAPAGATLS
ncbi:ABC transporter A family member 7-like isoform X3 [Andrographis paniculata]|uniref:ABC transporter A family member 7-like isoform X3 n=1 Tax=Andrographis paniculata TaxID=175694 RepID=UPI0021E7D626|nr:ABC transporter A family member 7-like isoform X3 [Andrographis paniculata]